MIFDDRFFDKLQCITTSHHLFWFMFRSINRPRDHSSKFALYQYYEPLGDRSPLHTASLQVKCPQMKLKKPKPLALP